jgi:hypothetical protein
MIKTCIQCGKEYNVRGKRRKLISKFCSRECKNTNSKGSTPWNKGTKGVMKPNSGSFKKGDKFWLGKKRSKEDRKKMSDAQKKNPNRYWLGKNREDVAGSNHHAWKGGITSEIMKIRRSPEMRLWRKSCLERDNFTCQKTGVSGGELHAHHINNFADFPELRFSIDNGIILSKKSHKEFHKKYGCKNNTKEQLIEFLT